MLDTKILVIDNDAAVCENLKNYFEKEGYEVKTVNDGVLGVDSFKLYNPDIVLLDIVLPKKDGWQVCREIREASSQPIIMISAKNDTFDKVLGLELGADDYVVKPFDIKELSARVKAVLRRTRTHTALKNDNEIIKFDNIFNIKFYPQLIIEKPSVFKQGVFQQTELNK
jgi:DNA-binding response OmpR family regulator